MAPRADAACTARADVCDRAHNAAVSQYFQVGDKVLWNPSTGVAWLFARSVEAVASAVELPTGLGAEFNDDYEVDVVTFAAFVDALVRRYRSSTHPILRTLIEGVAAVGIVMVERAGRSVASLSEQPPPIDSNDVAVFTTGLGTVGDTSRLRGLADELERAMPF